MKKATCIALAFALAVLFTASCGGGTYQAPPKANERPKATGGGDTGGSGVPKKEPTGPSYSKDYEPEAKAALTAWDTWAKEKTPANYAKVGTHLYNAMRYKIMTDRNGHSTGNFYKVNEVGRLFTDWKKTFQTGDWESDADYKEAKHAYNEVQQEQ
ncbi:MAG: hypothetical protein KDB90_17210 [Planctomycetes bacterium]|nr:hypothetical protein [Planctomycetota bacterium]